MCCGRLRYQTKKVKHEKDRLQETLVQAVDGLAKMASMLEKTIGHQ